MIYCHQCAQRLGLLADVYTSAPLQSKYQLNKFTKHTIPHSHPSASVFGTTSTGEYVKYVADAAASGSVEIDAYGRRNIIRMPGHPTGFRIDKGATLGPTDGVKVVLSSDAFRVHGFPINSTSLVSNICAACGGAVST
jgi:hypothetical protein